MENIIKEILEWPIIVQGALGSFLFWIILTIGQKLFKVIGDKYTADKKTGNYFLKKAMESFEEDNYEISTFAFFSAIYASIHYFLKFVLVVFIGFLIEHFIPVFGYVGYLIGFYFLFRSLSYVPHADGIDLKRNNNKN